ncbi:hypothetical protein AVEN_133473-1 [Araneus ventricosus]|uniref:Uncharacterized protein n=1 Tax=Araneus ventricosus TaxID=182803 RepID=A0A4Y2KDJ3_ARAVE|nr:hypothetical protein AVEN_133473-1 [Araneus ventricosus]
MIGEDLQIFFQSRVTRTNAIGYIALGDIVTKIVLWVFGGNSPTGRIMENDALFSNIPETRSTGNRKTQHLHKLTIPAYSKSRTITVIARTIALIV